MSILENILARKQEEVSGLDDRFKNAKPVKSKKNFKDALLSPGLSLIAEIKRKSPSKGDLWPELEASEVAEKYEHLGAAAISVLTDELFFGGSLADLQQVSRSVEMPVLRKDFILCEAQILEARLSGADAVLLMVSVLKNAEKIQALIAYAKNLNMHCLVEIHDEEELEIALESGAEIIGVNARKFKDLSVDPEIFQHLLAKVPQNIIKVAESGFYTGEDIEKVKNLADGVLIGTSFMEHEGRDLEEKLKIFTA